jgi:serine/threonine protein kinase
MVTGHRAFEGKSQLSVASAILEKKPASISSIKPLIPRSLDHIIRRCLAKDPEDRWQTTRDLAMELGSLNLETPIVTGSYGVGVFRGRIVGLSLGFLAGLLIAAAIFLFLSPQQNTSSLRDATRTSILAPEGKEFDRWGTAALSPDGKYLVFSAKAPGWGGGQLWLRRTDSLTAKPLPGTEGAENPFWSPDSKWIGFVGGSKLRKISVEGGIPLVICDSAALRGGSWSSNGTILFVPGTAVPVYSVPETGGAPVAITKLDKSAGELTHRWPVFLPDAKHFLFYSRGKENAIYATSVGSDERKKN